MFHSHEVNGDFRPLQDWVILAPVKEEKVKTRGGIVLPESLHEYGRCRVVAVGPGFKPCTAGVYAAGFIKTELKPGEFVYQQKFVEGEFKFRLNGEDVFAIRERHLNLTIAP